MTQSSISGYLSSLPISRKLLLLLLSVIISIAFVASITLVLTTYLISKDYIVPHNVTTTSKLLTNPLLISQIQREPELARHLLQHLSQFDYIESISFYDQQGKLLLSFPDEQHQSQTSITSITLEPSSYVEKIQLDDGQQLTLEIKANHSLPEMLFLAMKVAILIIMIFAVLIMLFVTGVIRQVITKPVLHLIKLAHTVSIEENYSVRATKFHNDELGILATAFNTMLNRIEARDQLLRKARDEAEQASMKAQSMALETQRTNKKLELEVQVRTHIEQKLTALQKYLNNIINSMPSALIAINTNKQIQQWNEEAAALFNIKGNQALQRPIQELSTILAEHEPEIDKALSHQTVETVERVPLTHHNEENYFDLVIYPLCGEEHQGAVIRLDNITQRIQLEDTMVQTEKMLSVGGLAAGMAHEINNPLGGIVQGVQNILRRISPTLAKNKEEAEKLQLDIHQLYIYMEQRGITRFLSNIKDAGTRASKIVQNMLQFSRRSSRTLSPTDLSELINRTIEIAHSDLDIKHGLELERIHIITNLDDTLTSVPCIANELEQVLLNLIKNAAQAINQREEPKWNGKIIITSKQTTTQAIIKVEDNGIGMDNTTRKRIFEPFFTTKEVGIGTGLGLSVSYFIITNNHKGQLHVKSAAGIGTEFIISLPLKVELTPIPKAKAIETALRD
ncbi:sensor histidine kinase [Spartinivicinus poritis]|uniref:histidine kinase n=1 Tax=Spartinivicinus poritis TaxID=2994640 RepID=A0ABT5U8X7_9GAMM|nr:HAMP domain-containing sensor histidine kinase [Spartinivicinus sp. A2-2]MDE1462828.1 ATP-binding protein [Spartinivicinus sp. A2-2]